MPTTISLPLLNRQTKFLNELQKAGVEFDVELTSEFYGGKSMAEFRPKIKNAKSLADVATCFQAKLAPIKVAMFNNFKGLTELLDSGKDNASPATSEHSKQANSPVKFFAQEAFSTVDHLGVYVITGAPFETTLGGHTYRTLISGTNQFYADVVTCLPETHPAYNYIDPNHVVVFSQSPNSADSFMFVTNQLSLDMNYIIAAFSVYPQSLKDIVENGAFMNYRDARINLLKAERAMPPRFQPAYKELKAKVLADFEKNAQNVMIGKLTRKEAPFIELNRIKITPTKASYETVSIEANDLAEVIFQKLNPLEEWDIFTLINIYTDYVEKYFDGRELNATATGFLEAANRVFKINGINIRVENFTTHVRRAVNGKLINKDELSKVMRRASCFDNQADFDAFVTGVSKVSLRLTDIVANGLPVKTVYLEEDRQHNKDAGNKHPKLKFIRKDSKFLLMIDKDTTRPVKRMVEFVNKIMACNRRHRMPYYGYRQTHEGGYETGQGPNDVEKELLTIFPEYIEGITAAEITALVKFVNKERIEAEKRSERFLAAAVQQTGAERMQYKEKWGYKIKGIMRNYFVEEDALRVYNYDTGQYICVVSKGFQGVGKDALVTRLFALSNDQYVAKDVGTLK
ncbi:MAG: hypothetical protein EBU46_04780 [Nitrosomonadaceae bacterium]|nr:hypothetical protein [Nitrosomonadaceae bacterium]